MSQQLAFAVLAGLAAVAFGVLAWRRLSLIRFGKPENRFDNLPRRAWDMLLYAFGQKRVLARPFGLNHFVIFWSFLVLLIANTDFIVSGLFPGISLRLLPDYLRGPLFLLFDVVSLLALVAVLLAIVRRLLFKLDTKYVKRRSLEGFLILIFIGLLMVAYFGIHGAEIARGQEPLSGWMPVSSLVARLPGDGAYGTFFWWVHAVVLCSFLVFLPISKHMHILTAIPNSFFARFDKPNTQPREEFTTGNTYGAGEVSDFTWKDLLDSFSCTECGRCQEACPATATNKALNPRQVIHSIKMNLMANSADLKAGREPHVRSSAPRAKPPTPRRPSGPAPRVGPAWNPARC